MFEAIAAFFGYTPYQFECILPILATFLAGTIAFLIFGGDAR